MLRRRRRCGGACWRRESVLSGVAGFVTPGLRRGAHHCTCTVHERYAQQRALQPEYTPTGRNHDGLSKARFPRCCQVDEDHQHRSLTGSYPQGRRHGRIQFPRQGVSESQRGDSFDSGLQTRRAGTPRAGEGAVRLVCYKISTDKNTQAIRSTTRNCNQARNEKRGRKQTERDSD